MYRFILFTTIFLIVAVVASNATPLDDYVNTPDPNFGWKRLQTYPLSTYTLYVLNMTSQKWFDGTRERDSAARWTLVFLVSASFSSQSVWWHYMIITVPRVLRRSQLAFLFISGGDNTDSSVIFSHFLFWNYRCFWFSVPTSSSVTDLAVSTGSVAVELRQIPNQPIVFKVRSKVREDL